MSAGDFPSSNGAQGSEPKPRGCKILIVDDDANASAAVADLVRSLGYEASCCSHAQVALDLVRMAPPDLILADYRMPEMTGLDLIRMLRHDGCNIPVIMMTGYAGTEDRISTEPGDQFVILRKPIDLAELQTALRDHIIAPSAQESAVPQPQVA